MIFKDKYNLIFVEGSWILIGQILTVFGTIVGIRALTGLLTPAIYGEITLAMTISTMVGQILTGPLGNGIVRYYSPSKEKGNLGIFVKGIRILQFNVTLLIWGLLIFSLFFVMLFKKTELIPLIFVAFLLSIIEGNNSILNGIQNAARQRRIVALHQGIAPWLRFIIASGIIIIFGPSSLNAITGYVLGIGIIYISQTIFFKKIIIHNDSLDYVSSGDSVKLRKEILNFSWPFSIWGLFTWLLLISDRWSINFFYSTKEVGLFAVLFQFGYYPVSLITGLMVQLVSPIFYQTAGDGSDEFRKQIVRKQNWQLSGLILILTIFIFLIVLFLHKLIFYIFVGPGYSTVSYLLPWFLLSGGIFAAGQFLSLNFQIELNTKGLLLPKIVTAVIGIIANILFTYLWGIAGVIMASLLFSTIYFIWILILIRKV